MTLKSNLQFLNVTGISLGHGIATASDTLSSQVHFLMLIGWVQQTHQCLSRFYYTVESLLRRVWMGLGSTVLKNSTLCHKNSHLNILFNCRLLGIKTTREWVWSYKEVHIQCQCNFLYHTHTHTHTQVF